MSVAQKVGQMTQLDVTQVISYTGGCPWLPWDDPTSCQPVLNREQLRRWMTTFHVGALLNSPFSAGCIGAVCGWTAAEWRAFMHDLQSEVQALGEPPILFGLDSTHGAGYVLDATLLPHQLNVGATFSRSLARAFGRIGAKDTRAAGVPWLFSPVLGLATHPLWPRVYETFGEDPLLVAHLGAEVIEGIQSVEEDPGVGHGDKGIDDGAPPCHEDANASSAACARDVTAPQPTQRVAACAKHFIGYSSPRSGHDRTPVYLSDRELRQYYVPPFVAAIDAGVLTVMEGYHELNGVPVVTSDKLLSDLLRDSLGFSGVLVTDWAEISNLHKYHHVARTEQEAVLLSINRTSIDVSMVPSDDSFSRLLEKLVSEGQVEEERLDISAARVMQLKKDLGLLGQPVPSANHTILSTVGSAEDQAVSLEIARESLVLLENRNGVLPIPRGRAQQFLIVGPLADSLTRQCGGWTHHWQGASGDEELASQGGETIVQAVRRLAPAGSTVNFATGCTIASPTGLPADSTCELDGSPDGSLISGGPLSGGLISNRTLALAAAADVIILALGEEAYTEKPGDINDLSLHAGQRELARAMYATGRPVALVLVQGRPRTLHGIADGAAAVLAAMVPGPHGGTAIAEVLLGLVNPSGRLPLSYPRFEGTFAPNWHPVTMRCATQQQSFLSATTAECPIEWPFGRGLSFTSFTYSLASSSHSIVNHPASFEILVSVTNTGARRGSHSALLFLTRQYQHLVVPDAQSLLDFHKLELEPGQTAQLTFAITTDMLAYVGEDGSRTVEDGTYSFRVGIPGECEAPYYAHGASPVYDYVRSQCYVDVSVTGAVKLPGHPGADDTAETLHLVHLFIQSHMSERTQRYLPLYAALIGLFFGCCADTIVRPLLRRAWRGTLAVARGMRALYAILAGDVTAARAAAKEAEDDDDLKQLYGRDWVRSDEIKEDAPFMRRAQLGTETRGHRVYDIYSAYRCGFSNGAMRSMSHGALVGEGADAQSCYSAPPSTNPNLLSVQYPECLSGSRPLVGGGVGGGFTAASSPSLHTTAAAAHHHCGAAHREQQSAVARGTGGGLGTSGESYAQASGAATRGPSTMCEGLRSQSIGSGFGDLEFGGGATPSASMDHQQAAILDAVCRSSLNLEETIRAMDQRMRSMEVTMSQVSLASLASVPTSPGDGIGGGNGSVAGGAGPGVHVGVAGGAASCDAAPPGVAAAAGPLCGGSAYAATEAARGDDGGSMSGSPSGITLCAPAMSALRETSAESEDDS